MNARYELLNTIPETTSLLCATLYYEPSFLSSNDDNTTSLSVSLPVNHSKEEFDRFLDLLNFEYDAGYGGQELYGTLWFTDGRWATRGEYDGSEWWNVHNQPEIPSHLLSETITQPA
jgi:hypothetical protein